MVKLQDYVLVHVESLHLQRLSIGSNSMPSNCTVAIRTTFQKSGRFEAVEIKVNEPEINSISTHVFEVSRADQALTFGVSEYDLKLLVNLVLRQYLGAGDHQSTFPVLDLTTQFWDQRDVVASIDAYYVLPCSPKLDTDFVVEQRQVCVFCGSAITGNVSVEHVLPLWLQKELEVERLPIELSRRDYSPSTRRHGHKDWKTKWCKSCNTGWMAQLETAVAPLLKGLINGTSKECDARLVTRWLVKTALTMNVASDYHHYFLLDEARAIFEDKLHETDIVAFAGINKSVEQFDIQQTIGIWSYVQDRHSLVRFATTLSRNHFIFSLQLKGLTLVCSRAPLVDLKYVFPRKLVRFITAPDGMPYSHISCGRTDCCQQKPFSPARTLTFDIGFMERDEDIQNVRGAIRHACDRDSGTNH